MIKPTVGRVVWFTPHLHGDTRFDATQPLSASIAYVYSDRLINVGYLDQLGVKHSATSVPLIQDGDTKPEDGFYCEWMPYQKQQAEKQESTAVARFPTDSRLDVPSDGSEF